jgi:hypothetical protein
MSKHSLFHNIIFHNASFVYHFRDLVAGCGCESPPFAFSRWREYLSSEEGKHCSNGGPVMRATAGSPQKCWRSHRQVLLAGRRRRGGEDCNSTRSAAVRCSKITCR